MLLLSCALQSAGYQLSAVEPAGIGFSHIDRLREIVLGYATDRGCRPELLSIKAEQIVADAEFDFAFSMNVMEHVDDVPLVLRRIVSALRPGAAYRFVCPNYRFPYEPHFDMPRCSRSRSPVESFGAVFSGPARSSILPAPGSRSIGSP